MECYQCEQHEGEGGPCSESEPGATVQCDQKFGCFISRGEIEEGCTTCYHINSSIVVPTTQTVPNFNWNSWTEPGGDWGTNATDNMFARGCATEQLSSCQNELVGDSA